MRQKLFALAETHSQQDQHTKIKLWKLTFVTNAIHFSQANKKLLTQQEELKNSKQNTICKNKRCRKTSFFYSFHHVKALTWLNNKTTLCATPSHPPTKHKAFFFYPTLKWVICKNNLNCRHLYFYSTPPINPPRVKAFSALTLLISQPA